MVNLLKVEKKNRYFLKKGQLRAVFPVKIKVRNIAFIFSHKIPILSRLLAVNIPVIY